MKRLRTQLAIAALMLATVFMGACAQNPESAQPKPAPEKPADTSPRHDALQVKDVPMPVQKTIAAESKGGTLVGLSTEKENKETLYEVELKVNGRGKNLLIDAAGVVTEIESEIKLSELQPAVRTEIQKTAGKSKIVGVESLTKKNKLEGYEVQLQDSNGKKSEVAFDISGRRKAAEKEEEEDEDDEVRK